VSLRVGVVGGGLVAQAMHLHFLAQLSDRFDLVALAEPSASVRAALQRRYGLDGTYADHRELLDGSPLDGNHGAPVRLLSPSQYGFVSTKHLCRIELHTEAPPERYHPAPLVQFGLQLVKPHRRARVWHEERHRHLPAWLVRPVYLGIIPAIRRLSARGSVRRNAGA